MTLPMVTRGVVDNSVKKKQNQVLEVTRPTSLDAPVSPPKKRSHSHTRSSKTRLEVSHSASTTLAVLEAGSVQICDHLSHFSLHLQKYIIPSKAFLTMRDFQDLYTRNKNAKGRHFVIHQHDHPIAGTHYDLRLQISESSSVSFAIMYGLPGNPNSKRLNRNATETRVHNLWNHLIETASHATGSLLIWDTGEYSILPYRQPVEETDDELSGGSSAEDAKNASEGSDAEKLYRAFQYGKVRIRLHGSRLPRDYTIALRLSRSDRGDRQPHRPDRNRRRKGQGIALGLQSKATCTSDDDVEDDLPSNEIIPSSQYQSDTKTSTLDAEIAEREDEEVRRTNAYSGASNTINSIHQRTWYLSLDRPSSGFEPKPAETGRRVWRRRCEAGRMLGFEPFFVQGKEVERSVVTGRTAEEVLLDEGVHGYVGRRGWRAVIE